MELINWIFESGYHFFGTILLIAIISGAIEDIINAIKRK